MATPEPQPPFRFSKRAIIITSLYTLVILALNIWLVLEGVFKGALFGKIFGFSAVISIVFVFYVSHPKNIQKILARKDHRE
jgi:hypothetical protein